MLPPQASSRFADWLLEVLRTAQARSKAGNQIRADFEFHARDLLKGLRQFAHRMSFGRGRFLRLHNDIFGPTSFG